jgi:lysophospholipase L1-like esterase
VEESNEMLKGVVGDVNRELRERDGDGKERVKWVESRHLIGKDMLDDHVHFNEEGYRVWDGVLWPLVAELLGIEDSEKGDEKTADGDY